MCIGNMTKTLVAAQQQGIFNAAAGQRQSSAPRLEQTYNGSRLTAGAQAQSQPTRRGGGGRQANKSVMY